MQKGDSALFTDLYQLNLLSAYIDHGETAAFELFVRKVKQVWRRYAECGRMASDLVSLVAPVEIDASMAWWMSAMRL